MKTSRRTFIKKSGLTLGTAMIINDLPTHLFAASKRLVNSFGFQTWTIREELMEDFPGTLKMMADLGYKEVEMCSPLGYKDSGFGPLFGMSGREMRSIIEDAGLICTSSHFNMGELRDHLEDRIQWAIDLGMKQMICSSFWLEKDATVDDYRKAADELNEIAVKTKESGLQMGFHNHHMEFEKRGDELIYNALLDQFDPDLVKMQFQVAVVNIGYKAADYFRKYPGRFISAHLSDWSSQKETQVPIGQGIVDWKDFFKATKTGGVQNVYVEMDPDTFQPSASFLKKL